MTDQSYDPRDPRVAVIRDEEARYGDVGPFHPPVRYPEYPFGDAVDPTNTAYALVRESFRVLGLDEANTGTARWNPLGSIVRPGNRVVLKPNAVNDRNQDPHESPFASITHPSVLRAVADYCVIALGGRGEIVIADAPIMTSDFAAWLRLMQLESMQRFYASHGVTLRVIDLRETTTRWILGFTPSMFRRTERRDPEGYTDVDLGAESMLAELSPVQIERAYGADYRVDETIRFHSGGRHTYRVANTMIGADALITVPKLKVHMKVGATLAIKGMVGLIGDKNSIIHMRRGAPEHGGDEYPKRSDRVQAIFHDWRTWLITKVAAKQTLAWDAVYFTNEVVRRSLETVLRPGDFHSRLGGGSWSGNDTAWRMGCDLLRIALYARPGQSKLGTERRRIFTILDGVIGGDRHGPLAPRARQSGIIVAAQNPAAADWVGARLMNIDPRKLKLLTSCHGDPALTWSGAELPNILSNDARVANLWTNDFHLGFELPLGWRGDVEAVLPT